MTECEFKFGCLKNDEIEYESIATIELSDEDMAKVEKHIIDNEYSPLFEDMPEDIIEKCVDAACDIAEKEYPPFAADGDDEYDLTMQEYMPTAIFESLSEETLNKVNEKLAEIFAEEQEVESFVTGGSDDSLNMFVCDCQKLSGQGTQVICAINQGVIHCGDLVRIVGGTHDYNARVTALYTCDEENSSEFAFYTGESMMDAGPGELVVVEFMNGVPLTKIQAKYEIKYSPENDKATKYEARFCNEIYKDDKCEVVFTNMMRRLGIKSIAEKEQTFNGQLLAAKDKVEGMKRVGVNYLNTQFTPEEMKQIIEMLADGDEKIAFAING